MTAEELCCSAILAFFALQGAVPFIAPNQALEATHTAATGLMLYGGVGSQVAVYGAIAYLLLRRAGRVVHCLGAMQWALALAAMAVLSTIWSQFPLYTVRRSLPFAMAGMFGLYLAIRFPVWRQLRILRATMLALAVGTTVVALAMPKLGLDISAGHHADWKGVFTQKNACGRMMVLATAALLADWQLSWRHAASAFLFVIELVMSGSRSAWLVEGAIVLVWIMLLLVKRMDARTRVLVTGGAALTTLIAVCAGLFLLPTLSLWFGRDATLSGRTEVWKQVWIFILQKPWLGWGYEAFWRGIQGEAFRVAVAVHFVVIHAHNGLWSFSLLKMSWQTRMRIVTPRALRKGVHVPRVLLFRSELLPLSETFIAGQAAALVRFDPWFAGLKRIPDGIALDEARVIAVARTNSLPEKVARRVYLRTGTAPGFLRRIRASQPDLIHAHFATDACAALAINDRLRIPMMVTLHGYDVTSEDAELRGLGVGRAFLRRREDLWNRAQVFVCISEFIRRKALERGFPEEKLWVHSTGIDLHSFRPDAERRKKEPLVLFVGRLVEVKGCTHLLRAMRRVEAQLPEVRLVVLGDGPLRGALEAEALETLRRCEFLGAQPAATVRQWMRRAAIVAIPSDGREGLCMVACEAQAMEIPVTGFRGPGISEAVADGESALLVEQGNDGMLAEAIVTLLKDEVLAAKMGVAGRQRVERLFDLQRQTALLEDKYDEALGRG